MATTETETTTTTETINDATVIVNGPSTIAPAGKDGMV